MEIANLRDSNDYVIDLIEKEEPFMICRVGIGAETNMAHIYKEYGVIDPHMKWHLSNNAGIYISPSKEAHGDFLIELYCKRYIEAIKHSSAMAVWSTAMVEQQESLRNRESKLIHSRVLEPFYCSIENYEPWSRKLIGKKVLIINPFVDSFKKQRRDNFHIFKDPIKRIFSEDQEFIFYKSFQTAAGNHLHDSWLTTFIKMCADIEKLDFDVALLGCGGYGLPLCDYIYTKLGKSAIYVGGGLQLMFGVMGKRWEENPMWKTLIDENNIAFIRPSQDEILKNMDRIEGACYW